MLKQKFLKINENPVSSAVLYIMAWAAAASIIYVFAEYLLVNALTLMLGFTIIYPVLTLMINFMYAKRNGIRWYMPAFMLLLIVLGYIFIKDFSSITPNIIVTTVLGTVFGTGLGNCFADKYAVEAAKEERRKKKLHEDKKYKKILDD